MPPGGPAVFGNHTSAFMATDVATWAKHHR